MYYICFGKIEISVLIEIVSGIVLASISGVLFTANNFVINQTGVDVGDVILVRTVIQIIIYVLILMYRGEDFLPPTRTKKIFTILQGSYVFTHILSDSDIGI